MAIAIPYLNENSLISYPLAQDQEIPDTVRRLIVDAGITFCLPFYCTPILKRVDITHTSLEIILGSLESIDTFATITYSDLRYYDIGGHYESARVLGDCGEETSNQNYLSPTICMVIDMNIIDEKEYDGYTWEGSLLFDPHVISYEPLRFEKLILENHGKPPIEISPAYYRQLLINGGNNVSTTPTEGGIVISANPGAGEGKIPCDCDDGTSDINKPGNGLSGNVKVIGDGCVSIEPSPASPNEIIVRDSCVACCQCSQYIDKVNSLRGLANELFGVGKSIKDNITKLNDKIIKFNKQGCDTDGKWIEVLSAAGDDPGPRGKRRVYSVLSLTNLTCNYWYLTLLDFSFKLSSNEVAYVEPLSTWYVHGVSPRLPGQQSSDKARQGFPIDHRVDSGETVKVCRTFRLPSKKDGETSETSTESETDFSGTVQAAGTITLTENPLSPPEPNHNFVKKLIIE